MDPLTIDTVPLTFAPAARGTGFVVHVDEDAGIVRVDPVNPQEYRM
jgi:hypothetical protein